MDAGLSKRMCRTLEDALPKSAALRPPRNYDASTAIDLSNAENESIRPELQEYFTSVVEDSMTSETFNNVPAAGNDAVLQSDLASFFNTYFHPIHPVLPEHVIPTAGASDAIESLVHAICDEGDSILVPGPHCNQYECVLTTRSNINMIVARPPTYQNYDNYLQPSLQAAYDFAEDRSRIKAVLLCNPNNPLSRCYPKNALVECMEFCQEHGLHLISDESLALISLKNTTSNAPPFVSAVTLTEPLVPEGAVKIDPSRVHVVWSASKLFGSSGFRAGSIISQQNALLCKALTMLTAAHTNSIASLYLSSLLNWSQLHTLLALNSQRLTDAYNVLCAALNGWKIDFVTPTNGIFLFAKLGKNIKSVVEEKAFFNRLAVQGVRISPGRCYNGVDREYGWARLRFGITVAAMRAATERIAAFLEKEAA